MKMALKSWDAKKQNGFFFSFSEDPLEGPCEQVKRPPGSAEGGRLLE
jgi:hypothetical protein